MAHDIIANRDLKLMAIGYFFLSGLEPLADKLYNLSELRLLIGNTNKERIEHISEGNSHWCAARPAR